MRPSFDFSDEDGPAAHYFLQNLSANTDYFAGSITVDIPVSPRGEFWGGEFQTGGGGRNVFCSIDRYERRRSLTFRVVGQRGLRVTRRR